jgi:hypothetical protein
LTKFLNYNIKYFLSLLFFSSVIFILWSDISFSQTIKKDTVYHTPFDTNKIQNAYIFDNKSDTIGLQSFIWSDRRNLSEILNDKAGYFINYLGIGGRNPINYNNFDDKHIGIFRDGVQINDVFFGGFDQENISVSEIQKIEEVSNISSFLYGINSSGKALNIITKDAFQPTLFSQLRYSQDRYGAMFADFSLNIPFSKKFNFIFGVNSHFYDGYYQNSDFNVWRGRFKLNFYASPKLNIKASFYHTKINRRLNGGLVYSTDDTLKNANFTDVYSLGTYERFSNYYFDITTTANLFNDKNLLTKFIFYTINSSRILRNGENGVDTGVHLNNDYHYIQYGLDFKQYYKLKFANSINSNFLLGGNAYFNYYNYFDPAFTNKYNQPIPVYYQNNIYSVISKLDVFIKSFLISGSCKLDYFDDNLYNYYGLEGSYKFIDTKDIVFNLKGGANSTIYGKENYWYMGNEINNNVYYTNMRRTYYEIGFESNYKNLYLDVTQYNWKYNWTKENALTFSNGYYSIKLLTKYIDFGINTNYSSDTTYPAIFIKSDIIYHNFFFNNKLNLKLGISIKYFSETPISYYSQERYDFSYNYINGQIIEKSYFNMDFYIGARIGTANVNITVANIFDNLNYTTAIYPYDARGGFLNTIARFSIVWDFNR